MSNIDISPRSISHKISEIEEIAEKASRRAFTQANLNVYLTNEPEPIYIKRSIPITAEMESKLYEISNYCRQLGSTQAVLS